MMASCLFNHFVVAGERTKAPESRCVKNWATTLAMLPLLSASLALAEDFKMINGKVYKNATISRVEADGIVLRTKTGIHKIYFVELPKDVQERFHYAAATPVAAQREPIKAEAKQDDSSRADQTGWAGAMPVSALFLRVLSLGALAITGVILAIVRVRFR
jgi:hypothetical protein